jgi:transposase-like protein
MAHPILSAEHFHNEEAAYEYVEARLWPNGPTCPHCGNADPSRIGRLQGKSTRLGVRKCYACRKPFTVKVGTIFEDSHLAMHLWLQAIHLLAASKKGFSTNQMRRTLGCGMKTAWFLTHRVREMMAPLGGTPLMGGEGSTVEIDETWIGGLEENKHANKRHFANDPKKGKTSVIALVERQGAALAYHMPEVTGANLRTVIRENVERGARFYSDESNTIRSAVWSHPSDKVNHHKGEYVRGDVHTNTVEGFFSIVKRGLTGVYHSVSKEHLDRYLAEYAFRYSNRSALGIEDVARADLAIIGAKGKHLTYETTRAQRREEASEV